MKNIIAMILAVIMMVSFIPAQSAYAQTYEEAVANRAIIEELVDEGFALGADSNLWIYHETNVDDEEMGTIDATYDILKNEGTMKIIYKVYDKATKDFELAVEYTITFKWYPEEEEFWFTSVQIQTYRFVDVDDLLF